MTQADKSRSPYFDDYNPEKNFHEILFRPRYAVQTRELNQIQSMFKEQIKRFGDHVFEEGSVVIPGESNYDLDLNYITVNVNNYNAIASQLVPGQISVSSSNGISANVKLIAKPTSTDPLTLYLEYLDSSDDGEVSRFPLNENVQILRDNGTVLANAQVTDEGIASKFTINDGVYYIGGRFVLVQQESVLLDKYGNMPSKIVGLEYNEVIVTENDDQSLFDNAQGVPNFRAPGAHRIRVDTKLSVFDIEDVDLLPENVVEIFRIDEGVIQRRYSGPEYNILNDVLAQRTYEESGDYTVKSFSASFDESENDNTYMLNLGPGLAYVNGYRVETIATTPIETNRARERGVINNSSISSALGFYVVVGDVNILPDLNSLQEISFYENEVTTPGVEPSGSLLGKARVRFVRKDGNNYRLYLFDVKNSSGQTTSSFLANSSSVFSSQGTPFSANLTESLLFDSNNNSLLFPLNVQFVATLKDQFGNSDTSYSSVKQITSTTDSNGQLTLSAAPNEVFVQQDSSLALASFTDTGEFYEIGNDYSLSGAPLGSVITVNFGGSNSGRQVRVNLQVAKQDVQQKIKTPTNGTITGSLTNGSLSLNKADAYEIISVKDDNDADVTDLFALNTNKTNSYYGVSSVTTNSTVAEPVTIEFRYFSHSAGDYFGVDSYASIDYKDIPVENGIRLSDVLDFRPRMNDAGTGFIGTGSSVGNIPTPFSIIRSDVDHYLPRKDKVYVTTSGEFGIKQGVPSLNPNAPEDPSNSMIIYELELPAYTFSPSDIQAKKVSNRRYTMKDIGRLEDRISNIEYYVSLNLLEQEAESRDIVDPVTGLNRFKNGFLTDSFVDHSVGDFGWEGYHVSMSDDGELRPEFSLYATDLEINSSESSNIVERNGIVTLPYTEKSFVRQNQRSTTINVNPYAVYRWVSDLQLSPSIDSWIDTVYKNPDVTYRVYNNGKLTQTWKSWQVNWTGGTTTTQSINEKRATQQNIGKTGLQWESWRRNGVIETTTNTTTRTNIDIVGDKVIDTSVIPYMRSINVSIKGVGNRPKSRMHFFFDGVKINQWVRPANSNTLGSPVYCNEEGEFNAVFRIPNNSSKRFRTGDKVLVATDEPNNITERATSYGESIFTSSGVLNTRQRTIIATRQSTSKTTSERYIHRDPIAQSFVVERSGGAFITKINVFFSSKDPKVPVTIELREMENGIPTQRIIPGGVKQLLPKDVSTSSNGSAPTTFEFPYPVHLTDGNEYCFVLVSNSNLYNIHIATMGEQDKGTNKFIVEQPYSGVMFKSQNNSTWTEDQNSDVQFEIFAAQFDTNVVGTLVLENKDLDDVQLDVNPLYTTSGSNEVIINRFMHNYVVGTQVGVSGALAGNGISQPNGSYIVKEVIDPNNFVVEMSSSNVTGRFGGDEVFISDTIQASVINPNIRYVELPNTGIEYMLRGTTGMSIDGTEAPYNETNFIPVTNGEINDIDNPWLVTNRNDEQTNMNGRKSVRMEVSLASINPNVSPVVDLDGSNIIMPFSMITYPEIDSLDGSNNHANYRTRTVSIKNPANALKVFFDAVRPEGSDVILSARFGNSEEELESSDWVELEGIVEDVTGDGSDFKENEYGLEDVGDYTVYQLMIQIKSRRATKFPILRRLRVMSLGT